MCGAHADRWSRRPHSTYAAPLRSVYHPGVGTLRTSEEGGELVGGEAKAIRSDDDARKVDAPGQIIIDSAPIVMAAPAVPSRPAPRPGSRPTVPQRARGLGLVVVVYILAAAALAAAIYERFWM